VQRLTARVIGIGVRPEHIRDSQTQRGAPRSLRYLAVLAGILTGVALGGVLILRKTRSAQAHCS
jgi:hypothetical protein